MTTVQELFFLFSLVFFIFPSPSHQLSSKNHATTGFTTKIIHRNSPLSPFYNPNATASDFWNSAYNNAISRIAYFRSITRSSSTRPETIRSLVSPNGSGYIMKLKLGKQQQEIFLGVDTGSNLVWTQCLPCISCFNQSVPIFDPSKSTSYRGVPCNTTVCTKIHQISRKCSSENICEFNYAYMDGSYTDGELAGETLTISSTSGEDIPLFNMLIGCGHENKGLFPTETGVAGLGPSELSLITQLYTSVYWRFSYCFVPYAEPKTTSYLGFGEDAVLSGKPTPMALAVDGTNPAPSYYLFLDDISVGKERLNIPPGTFYPREFNYGGLIIDSGTTLTVLAKAAYNMLFDKLKEEINLEPSTPTEYKQLSLCYKGSYSDLVEKNIPVLTFHFRDLDVALNPRSTFIMLQANVVCLAMMPTDDLSIFGNLAQQNMNVGYDLLNQDVYIAPANCATK